jgi:hypothetical protein
LRSTKTKTVAPRARHFSNPRAFPCAAAWSAPGYLGSVSKLPTSLTVQRSACRLKRQMLNGATSMCQKLDTGAASTRVIAARTTDGCVTATAWPLPEPISSIHVETRSTSALTDSPPCGAASASDSHSARSPGWFRSRSANVRPDQLPQSQSRSAGASSVARPKAAAVWRARNAGLVHDRSTRPSIRPSFSARATLAASVGSSSGNAAARVALVAAWQINVNRIGDRWSGRFVCTRASHSVDSKRIPPIGWRQLRVGSR